MADYLTNEMDLILHEKQNADTTWTNNDEMEKSGYTIVRNLWDPEELYHPLPYDRGQTHYMGSIDKFNHIPVDPEIEGSYTRISYPQYQKIYTELRKKLEGIIGRKLSKTFYYDRFWFSGNQLKKHLGPAQGEIMVVISISTNLKRPWPFVIKTRDQYTDKNKTAILVPGTESAINLEPGDGIIFKGCERPHWRDTFPEPKKRWFSKKEKEVFYHHDITFQYVITDGQRSHIASA